MDAVAPAEFDSPPEAGLYCPATGEKQGWTMERPQRMLLVACLASLVAQAIAAAYALAAQDLVNVKKSEWVLSASWSRQMDTYVLEIVLNPSPNFTPLAPVSGTAVRSLTKEEMDRLGIVNVAQALQALVPQNAADNQTNMTDRCASAPDRGSAFICSTILHLRKMDPAVPCSMTPVAISAWLIHADGTPIPPAAQDCDVPPDHQPITVSYSYSIADGAQAKAVDIDIGPLRYNEPLQPRIP